MAGLLQDSLNANQQADGGLGVAADQSARQYMEDLQLKSGLKQGLGELAGVGAGLAYQKNLKNKQKANPDLASPPLDYKTIDDPNFVQNISSPHSMLLGTTLQKLWGGLTNQIDGSSTPSIGGTGASSFNSNPPDVGADAGSAQ